MFEIKPAYSESPVFDKLMVIDEGRDVWLQRIGGMGSEPGSVFKLVWKGQEIAFDVFPESRWDENGKEYIILRFGAFGKDTAQFQGNIDYWRAETADLRREAKMLAVEALLAYGMRSPCDQGPLQIDISKSRGHAAWSLSPPAFRSFPGQPKRRNHSPAEHPAQTPPPRGQHHLGIRGRLILGTGGDIISESGGDIPRNLHTAADSALH